MRGRGARGRGYVGEISRRMRMRNISTHIFFFGVSWSEFSVTE